jgi:hypothetical protein
MLDKQTRKKLLEREWPEIKLQESNPTQTLVRLRNIAIKAINDLTLVAQKLPEDTQKEIFTPSRIDGLIQNIFYKGNLYHFQGHHQDIFDPRRAELAALLVERGVHLNSVQYRMLNKDTLSLVEPTINHLEQSVSICKDIARKLELKKIEEEAEQMELVYLFSWKKMLLQEKGRLMEFIYKKTRQEDPIEIIWNTIKRTNDKKIECSFGVNFGPEEQPDTIYGTISIVMNDTKTAAEVRILDSIDNITHQDELVVKPADNYSNDFNLFEKNRRNRKKRQ